MNPSLEHADLPNRSAFEIAACLCEYPLIYAFGSSHFLQVTNDDVKDELATFVLAKNLLRSIINSADLRTPTCAYLYGTNPSDNAHVIEIKAIAVPPQRASQRSIELPDTLPQHPLLDDLRLIGVIMTQSQESQALAPHEAFAFAKLLAKHEELDGSAILLTVAFTPGSLSLAAHCLTPKGFEFCRDADINAPNGLSFHSHLGHCAYKSLIQDTRPLR